MAGQSGTKVRSVNQAQAPVDADREDGFRLTPRKPRFVRDVQQAAAFVAIMRTAREQTRAAKRAIRAPKVRASWQRCMVKIRFSRYSTGGRWYAHALYITRPSATGKDRAEAGFTKDSDKADVRAIVKHWKATADPRMFRMVISPERPDADLQKLVRDVMHDASIASGRNLEWAAVIHTNTDHPHAHIVIRGRADGADLKLDASMIKYGFRRIAQDHLTRQLGHRLIDVTPSPMSPRKYGLTEPDGLQR